ncbi:hypothetical protein PMAYCL1PPCAC_16527, partial [Pristionchus mayeri]
LSLRIHREIKTIRHVLTALSVSLAVPALVVVVLCANQTSKKYSALITLLVVSVFTDVVLNLVWDPLMLLPALCILREQPAIPLPGGPNDYYELYTLLVALNAPAFGEGFLERHQVCTAFMI